MPSRIKRLIEQQQILSGSIPHWLESNLHLEVIMGSRAYGCHSPDSSDYDMRGIYTPPKVMLFPATEGLIVGYDQIPQADHWNPGKPFKDKQGNEYDFDIHNITKFFRLAQENNPNQIDLLFAPENCITHCSAIGRMVLDKRSIFLSKLCWKRFRGYASDQFKYVQSQKGRNGNRAESIEKYGYDVKFASHCIRLLRECEQILTEGHLDLTESSEELKAIRMGEWSYERLEQEFMARKIAIEKIYPDSKLPEVPDREQVRTLLLDCLEHHYGSLSKAVLRPDETVRALREIDYALARIRPFLEN